MELLKAQTLLLSRRKLNVSSEVSDFVGKGCLKRWQNDIWPIACQTCGKPQGDEAFISADGLFDDDKILLSLHHGKCRGSKTTPRHEITMRIPTWAASIESRGEGEDAVPLMVVNPSCEQLMIQRPAIGRSRNVTLDIFTAIGFKSSTGTVPDLVDTMEARLDGNRLTVALTAKLSGETSISAQSFTLTVSDGVRHAAQHSPFLMVAMTTKMLPLQLVELAPVFEDEDPEVVSALVPFRR